MSPAVRRAAASLVLWTLAAVAAPSDAAGEAVMLDDFEELSRWTVVTSDGVTLALSAAEGSEGRGARLDYDFQRGAGYCIIRRTLDLPLPVNYRFTFLVRGEGPGNNLEFKLADPSGENVWWQNRRAFEFPKDWTRLVSRARNIQFAWGPNGSGVRLDRVGSMEFAIAASTGGKGTVYLDSLTFQPLPDAQELPADPPLQFSSVDGAGAPRGAAALPWRSAADDRAPWVTVDLGSDAEFGGLALHWDAHDFAIAYDLEQSADGVAWRSAAAVGSSDGGWDHVRLPGGEGRYLRVVSRKLSGSRGAGLQALRVLPPAFAESKNVMLSTIAADAPRGLYPRMFLGEPSAWTVMGASGGTAEALINDMGAVEIAKGLATLEPFIAVGATDGPIKLSGAIAGSGECSLAEGHLPIPTTRVQFPDRIAAEVTAFVAGGADQPVLYVRYRLRAPEATAPLVGTLCVAVRPFQVLPPWQDLNMTGGVGSIRAVTWDGTRVVLDGARSVVPLTPCDRFAAAAFNGSDIVEQIGSARAVRLDEVKDEQGLASGAMLFPFELADSSSYADVVIAAPLDPAALATTARPGMSGGAVFQRELAAARQHWGTELGLVQLKLPESARALVDTFRSQIAYILINRDEHAIQPGSRTYERTWIRDGALTSTALLYAGHAIEVRQFLDWFAPFQYPDGKIPCCVDRRGADPVPEHDSHGQYIYGVNTYHQFSGDDEFLRRHWPHVVGAVKYIEFLRAQRMTDEYRAGPPAQRAKYGLVPESISHEGYSAKPMHSYWDDFWTLRGLKDAVTIATALGESEAVQRFTPLRDDFASDLYASMQMAMSIAGIDYIPGCVELGDFDASSTAVGVFPCGELGRIPEPALHRTFEKYFDWFVKRRDGQIQWRDYTPYEMRNASVFTMLGQPDRTHVLLDFFLAHRKPVGWNQWPEIVYADPAAAKFIGDMPHTWVGSDYVKAVRNLFVYERESDGSLVLGAGIKDAWLDDPVGVEARWFPVERGTVSIAAKRADETLNVDLDLDLQPGRYKGGSIFRVPGVRPIRAVRLGGVAQAVPGRDREIRLSAGVVADPIRLEVDFGP